MTTTKTKDAADLRVGDLIYFLGTPHRIDRIDPPEAATLAIAPDCIGYAREDTGWGITLLPGLTLDVPA